MVKRLSLNKSGEAGLFFVRVLHAETRLKVLRGESK